MTLTQLSTDVSAYFYNTLEANKASLGIQQVFDGDRQLIAVTPTIAVIPGDKNRELYGASLATTVDFTQYLLVYTKRLDSPEGPVEGNERDAMEMAERIEAFFHQDAHLGGLVQIGFFTRIEPGYANRGERLLRTVRMTWEGRARSLGLSVTS